ncbi:MAG: T9SS type A sorting domain-containing protein [Bacteroidetes bacterium]|nr:T9SS type A sorting domain-containing protein [Bacteroidota bacterium]
MKNIQTNMNATFSSIFNPIKTITMRMFSTLLLLFVFSFTSTAQTELLVNPNFTSENYGWSVTQDFKYNTQFSQYNFDLGYAYLAQNDHAYGILEQSVTIPSNTSACTFSFYCKITSDEISTTEPFDICSVQLVDNLGNVYLFSVMSNLDESGGYMYKSFTVPSSFYGKTVRFRFIGDNDGLKPTIFRIDNCSVKATTTAAGKPDLNITSPAISNNNVYSGSTVTISADENNINNTTAGSHYVKFYLSSNTSLDGNDTYIGEQYVNLISPLLFTYCSKNYTIPTLASGTYYILFQADGYNNIDESNEYNNINAVQFTVQSTPVNKPDLTVTSSFSTPSSITTDGNTILLNVNFKNQGTGNSSAFSVKYFLSETSAYNSTTAVLLATQSYNALNTGSSSAASIYLTIPSGLSAGTKYILSYVDPSNSIDESNESNNNGAATLSVTSTPVNKPDLTVTSSFSTPGSITTDGNTILLNVNFKNQGTGNSSAFAVKYFLSETSAYNSATAVLLATQSYNALSTGSSSTASIYLTIPSGLSAGTKYILSYVDPSNSIDESNENNNIGAAALVVNNPTPTKPELIITNFTAPTTSAPLGNISVNCTIQNLGGTTANNFVVSFHLSNDATVNAGDLYLGEYPVSSLSSNQYKSFVRPLTIPSNAGVGQKIIIASVDGGGTVDEQLENNNSSIFFITINNQYIQALEFNPTKSHLYWPFYNSQDNSAGNPFSKWSNQFNGSTHSWHYTNNHDLDNNGESDHHIGESHFAQDWNYLSGNSDCGMSFYAPFGGTIIRLSDEYSPSSNCVNDRSHSTAGNYFILLSTNGQYAFKACHFNELSSNLYVGKVILSGDYLGKIGNTGSSDGTHAHCQLYKNLNSSLVNTLRNYGKIGSGSTDYTYACDFDFDAILDGTGGDDSVATSIYTSTKNIYKVYPNPAHQWFTVELDQFVANGQLQLIDLVGNVVFETAIHQSKTIPIETIAYTNGLYLIHVRTEEQEYTGKILIQH